MTAGNHAGFCRSEFVSNDVLNTLPSGNVQSPIGWKPIVVPLGIAAKRVFAARSDQSAIFRSYLRSWGLGVSAARSEKKPVCDRVAGSPGPGAAPPLAAGCRCVPTACSAGTCRERHRHPRRMTPAPCNRRPNSARALSATWPARPWSPERSSHPASRSCYSCCRRRCTCR